MLSSTEFVRQSLDLHLFFLRIMKEHAFFLETAFTPRDSNLIEQAGDFQSKFDKLLAEVVILSNGVVSPSVLISGEVVTPFTLNAETVSSYFTGVDINTDLTKIEYELQANNITVCDPKLEQKVTIINNNIMGLVVDLINYKSKVLSYVLSCDIFTRNYPSLLEHIIHEAKFYLSIIQRLQNRQEIIWMQEAHAQEAFWNHIMGDHAKVIRGLLDPSEEKLIAGAEYFAKEFEELTKQITDVIENTVQIAKLTNEAISATEGIQDFKQQATQGLLECKIKSIIIPLLADHVLREANHYLRLLKIFEVAVK